MPGTQQPTIGTYYFKLKLGGYESAKFFKECTGLSSENSVVEDTSTDEQGKAVKQKVPGQLTWTNITLKRGVDDNADLWGWRQKVIDGKFKEARTDGTIEVVDWEGKPVVTYSFLQGWPCKYSAPGLNAGGNEILVEEVEIAHEGFTRA
jgi:phage tail-like protein